MKGFKAFPILIELYATILIFSNIVSVNGQISTACTASMITSFTPCLNYITGSSGNGSSPTADCCNSLKSVMSDSVDCGCLIITGNVPVSLPINRQLAISLPRACKTAGVPLQCKASGVPLPAPGPVIFGAPSTLSPSAASPLSPRASKAVSGGVAAPPDESTSDITPAAPPVHSVDPTATPGIRPVLTPKTSASNPLDHISLPSVLLIFLGIMVFKF